MPAEYLKRLLDESNKMNVVIMFGDRVVSFGNFVTPNDVTLREVI
jgi:hypothetical protein